MDFPRYRTTAHVRQVVVYTVYFLFKEQMENQGKLPPRPSTDDINNYDSRLFV